MKCPICSREIVDGISSDEHHLVPRTFKGRETIRLHRVCHQKIHSVLTERELLNYYHTIERLLEREEIQTFVKWVSKKPPEYYDSHRDTNDRSRKRKR